MTSPIDPIRKNALVRRTRNPHAADEPQGAETEDRQVPVVIEGSPAHTHASAAKGASVFAAQLMGQGGQKRGLRGGPETLGAAKSAYHQTEWSGGADRRARKGGVTKTDI